MKKEQNQKPQPAKSDFLKNFEMSENDDLELEEDDHEHVHQEGCCSCHSNVGK